MGEWYSQYLMYFRVLSFAVGPSITLTSCLDISLKISRLREGLGVVTNNVAEYRGLILGLKYAIRHGFKRIKVNGDSQLVCYQVCVCSLSVIKLPPFYGFWHLCISLLS